MFLHVQVLSDAMTQASSPAAAHSAKAFISSGRVANEHLLVYAWKQTHIATQELM